MHEEMKSIYLKTIFLYGLSEQKESEANSMAPLTFLINTCCM
jgi:hypothetical protein